MFPCAKLLCFMFGILSSLDMTSAVPTSNTGSGCSPQVATFDDIKVLQPATPSAIGTYRSLNFPGIFVGTFLSTSPIGVIPQSGTQYALFNLETKLLALSPVSGITVENDGSTTKSFTLGNFYYGCSAATQTGLAGAPVACTLVAKGYNAAGKLVAQQSFAYKFTANKQGMTLAQPIGFSSLYNVTFSIAPSATSAATVGLLDSINLSTCTS